MKNEKLPLEHIRMAMRFILDHVKNKEDLQSNEVLRYAVERNFEVIGEAAKRIPDSVKTHCPELPWKEMTGMRDVIIHEYDEIDIDQVWNTITQDIPHSLEIIEQLLREDA